MADDSIHISVLFQGASPELLYRGILQKVHASPWDPLYSIGSDHISEVCYRHCAHAISQTQMLTDNYLIECYHELDFRLHQDPSGGIFRILADYAQTLLRIVDREPLCLQQNVLELRERTVALGQDLFTCALLAGKDVREECVSSYFSWPSPVRMDHVEIHNMLEQGVSENHYHLYGSTRVFSVSWAFLMNHPEEIPTYFKNELFRENLHSRTQQGAQDNALSWEEKTCMAVWIRAYLFSLLEQRPVRPLVPNGAPFGPKEDFLRFCHSPLKIPLLKQSVSILMQQGVSFDTRKGSFALDYAVTRDIYEHNHGVYRLLAGERSFLYRCFHRLFGKQWGSAEQDLLYLYLLISFQFRNELIQSNARKGFHNFASYQDRKCTLWGNRDDYWEESLRLSIGADIRRFSLPDCLSLELRLIPSARSDLQLSAIRDTDLSAAYALSRPAAGGSWVRQKQLLDELQNDCNFFYVMHFPKQPDAQLQLRNVRLQTLKPRNHSVRENTRQRARALMRAMESSGYLCSRIRGIDACNHEIGCRPEVFAVAFRYIRSFCCKPLRPQQERYWPLIGLTYHVGEDFLDLADGLRAIDEAICFLDMQHRDRLGHALALGILPEHYYHLDRSTHPEPLRLPAQDLLDDLVWLLFRSLEWNVSMRSSLRSDLTDRAERLLHTIYPFTADCSITLRDYYNSWRLRGDDPSLYRRALAGDDAVLQDIQALQNSVFNRLGSYQHAFFDPHLRDYAGAGDTGSSHSGEMLRHNSNVQKLLYYYHFDPAARTAGQVPAQFFPSQAYSDLIYDMQERMMELISDKGLSIECNPSSNVLIGAFDGYQNHPLFRFNHYGLDASSSETHHTDLRVSINTDDQGIFETSLENEYALIYACLSQWPDEINSAALRRDRIFQYLDHLRCMGNNMTFQKASPRKQSRFYQADYRKTRN